MTGAFLIGGVRAPARIVRLDLRVLYVPAADTTAAALVTTRAVARIESEPYSAAVFANTVPIDSTGGMKNEY